MSQFQIKIFAYKQSRAGLLLLLALLFFPAALRAQSFDEAAGLLLSGKYEPSRRIFHELALRGETPSMFQLGYMFEKGLGGEPDLAGAYTWYYMAAENGYAPAQFALGLMCEDGRGTSADPGRALNWYLKAARQGYAYAQHNLGALYADGLGVPQNPFWAAYWFEKAACATHVSETERNQSAAAAEEAAARAKDGQPS